MGWFDRLRSNTQVIERGYIGPTFTIQDPALAEYITAGYGGFDGASGVAVNEGSVLGVTAAWMAVGLLSDTVAQLPLCTYSAGSTMVDSATGRPTRVASVFDNPGGSFLTPFEWKSIVVMHMSLWGEAFLLHMYNNAGQLVSLMPIHPTFVSDVKRDGLDGAKSFVVRVPGAERDQVFGEDRMTQIMYRTTTGLRGLSPITVERQALGLAIASERVAAKFYGNGFMLGGLITPKEELTDRQADALIAQMKAKLSGPRNAGEWAVVNASLQLSPWTMNAVDAQFLESRKYNVTECARIWGIPKVLMAEDGASTWGTGIAEIVRGWQKFGLTGFTERIAERCSRLLANPRYVEFEYDGLLKADPVVESNKILAQVEAGVISVNEARAALGYDPMPGADKLKELVAPAPVPVDEKEGKQL